jgi:thioredoxin reductase (NADPH)
MTQTEKVIVIGGGPAGMSAALYAARAELRPLVLTGMELGGQVALTNTIENYPGFPDGVGGSELGELFQKQAEKFGAKVEYDSAIGVNLSVHPFIVKTYNKDYSAEALILATGASSVHLNVPGESELIGKGVSYCATCDGWFFKEKKVVVVGGGDSALEEALFLTRYASKVSIVHRRNEFRAGALLQKRVMDNEKIDLILDTIVEKVLGSEKVEGVVLKNVKTNETREFPTDGVFVFIGHTPNTALFKGQLEMDEKGFLKRDEKMQTSVAGVFVAGEIADSEYKQVITSAGMGAAAAIQATRYLSNKS